jgi:threonine/homoserine/homoserine lactone efflux protein
MPVIFAAAATDVLYALLAAGGLIALDTASTMTTHFLAAFFCVIAAALIWTHRAVSVPSRAAFGLALLNPATAILWLGLSAMTVAHPRGPSATILWVLGVGAGTTTWFSGLALASSRIHRRLTPGHTLMMQRSIAILVAITAIPSVL